MSKVKSEAASYGLEFIAKNPGLVNEVNELYVLMLDEIEQGGSPDGEFESFKESVEQLLEEE